MKMKRVIPLFYLPRSFISLEKKERKTEYNLNHSFFVIIICDLLGIALNVQSSDTETVILAVKLASKLF